MKVLVPVDGSAHSMEALNVAADFASARKADIFVIQRGTLYPGHGRS